MTYRELTGYDPYDGFYDGYPECDQLFHETIDPTVQDLKTHFSCSIPEHDETDEDAFDSRLFAVASWHRVLHRNLDPKQLQPYLGFASLKTIRHTISRTTQMAKMIIRAPLRKHIKARLSFMQAKRLEEVVSTDPMFANCRSLGNGFVGGSGLLWT